MQIRYFATFRELTHENTRAWSGPAGTLGDLLSALCGLYGPRFADAIFDSGRTGLSPIAIVLVNGVDARHLEGIHTALSTNDTVSIFPMVAGG